MCLFNTVKNPNRTCVDLDIIAPNSIQKIGDPAFPCSAAQGYIPQDDTLYILQIQKQNSWFRYISNKQKRSWIKDQRL